MELLLTKAKLGLAKFFSWNSDNFEAALNSIAKTAAAELAPRKIRVNIVNPGPTKTEIMTKAGLDKETLKGLNDWIINAIPLKKMGTAADVAKTIVYLSDDDFASFMTGTEILIDGGMIL